MRNTIITILVVLTCLTLMVRAWQEAKSEPIIKLVPARTNGIYRVTAYCPCEKCCGEYADGITASGAPAQGKIVAAPPEIPFGTWLKIPEYGWAEVLDRGGSIKGKRLDVFFPTHQEALNWGVKYLEIEQ